MAEKPFAQLVDLRLLDGYAVIIHKSVSYFVHLHIIGILQIAGLDFYIITVFRIMQPIAPVPIFKRSLVGLGVVGYAFQRVAHKVNLLDGLDCVFS